MVDKSLLQMRYWDTYYFAQIVKAILEEPFDYLRRLEDFFGDSQIPTFLAPYPRWTSLHRFIEFVFWTVMHESIDDVMEDAVANEEGFKPWINEALDAHELQYTPISVWIRNQGLDVSNNSLWEYFMVLYEDGPLDRLIYQIAEEVFFLLFLNRALLRTFHSEIAERVKTLHLGDLDKETAGFLKKSGVLRRRSPPQWAKRAVFYRDRGSCVLCNSDLSGLLSSQATDFYDHIVPLALGGTNEVTNLQLLCSQCNSRKGGHHSSVGLRYERWFSTSIS